jgi:DNA-binding transcriptional LysR family regulator
MLTVKQLEAFYWTARLGTVSGAAAKLHISQSAATKRLQELEGSCAHQLFEQPGSKSLLTPKGRELFACCEELLSRIHKLEELEGKARSVARILQIGLTEVVATTWFPAFARKMRSVYPDVVVHPELLHRSVTLREKVLDGSLDIAFVPDVGVSEKLVRIALNAVPFAWFAPPGLFPANRAVTLEELASMPVIEQEDRSVITELCMKLLSNAGASPERILGGSSVVGTAALIEAGLGVSCLPEPLFASYVSQQRLQQITTIPPAPTLAYCATFLRHPRSAVGYAVSEIARQCCGNSDARGPGQTIL